MSFKDLTLQELRNILEHSHYHSSLQIKDLSNKVEFLIILTSINLLFLFIIIIKLYNKK